MRDHINGYQFEVNPKSRSVNEATRKWDSLQSKLVCCGLHSPDDWPRWNKQTRDQDLFPRSCCNVLMYFDSNYGDGKCHKRHVTPYGCLDRLELVAKFSVYGALLDVGYYFIVALLAVSEVKLLTTSQQTAANDNQPLSSQFLSIV